MKKSLKIFAVVLIAMLVVFSVSTSSYADSAKDVIGGINADTSGINSQGMKTIAGRVLGLLQIVSAILAVILVAYLGFKMVLGSANEKADVQKQFIPLIIGVTIVFAATSIANLLLGIMST
ncbi:MAG: TrbC/VirB2 family protein [Clostridia bacterium]|nr:TrbC/VirB2 family protein [Clostridia bacterium]